MCWQHCKSYEHHLQELWLLKNKLNVYLQNGTESTTRKHIYIHRFYSNYRILPDRSQYLMFYPTISFLSMDEVKCDYLSFQTLNPILFAFTTWIIKTGNLYLLCEIKTGGFSIVAILMPPISTQFISFIFILSSVIAYDSTDMLIKIT